MKTTVSLEQETLRNLNLIKYSMASDTLDDVINKLILNYKTQVEVEDERK
jgi:hypothetical protein